MILNFQRLRRGILLEEGLDDSGLLIFARTPCAALVKKKEYRRRQPKSESDAFTQHMKWL